MRLNEKNFQINNLKFNGTTNDNTFSSKPCKALKLFLPRFSCFIVHYIAGTLSQRNFVATKLKLLASFVLCKIYD